MKYHVTMFTSHSVYDAFVPLAALEEIKDKLAEEDPELGWPDAEWDDVYAEMMSVALEKAAFMPVIHESLDVQLNPAHIVHFLGEVVDDDFRIER